MSKKLSFCSLCILPVLTALVFFSVGSLQVSASYDLEDLDVFWFSEDFKEVFPFSEGYANFKDESGKYGVIDLNGKVLLPPTYEYMTSFVGGHAAFYQGKLKGIMDKSFKVVVEPFKSNDDSDSETIWENRPIFKGYSTFKEGDKVGLLDPDGKVVIPAKYKYLKHSGFSDDLATTNYEGVYYFFNRKGEIVFQLVYDNLYDFVDGIAKFRVNQQKYGLISDKGKMIVEAKFSHIGDFYEGLAKASLDGDYGFIDKMGKMVIEPKFEYVGNFSEGLAPYGMRVVSDETGGYIDKRGYIDKSGEIVISAKYEEAGPFVNGIAFVKLDGNVLAIDKTGKVLKTLPNYERVSHFADELYEFFPKNSKKYIYGLLDKNFREILPAKYSDIRFFKDGLSQIIEEGDGKKTGKYGFIDKTGEIVIPVIFDSAYDFDEGIALVKLNGRYGIIKNPLKYSASKNHSEPVKDSKLMNSEQKAIYSKANLQVNSHEIKDLEIYNIGGENYFKLRDVAKLASDRGQGFSVNWDAKENLILLKKEEKYAEVGGELAQGDSKDKVANESKGKVKVDEKDVALKAYFINGNNYYRLRDLAKELNFKVNWNGDKKRIEVEF